MDVVVADGAPFVAAALDLVGGASRQAANSAAIDRAVSVRAKTSESDLVAALALAGRRLAGRPGLRTVVVEDSGLSTSGAVDFTRAGMFEASPAEVAGNLADLGRLPSLDHASVVFQGLGETAAPQQPLDPVVTTQLQAIWTAVVRGAGADDIRFDPPVDAGPAPADLPAMRRVLLPPGISCSGSRLTLLGGPVSFQPLDPSFVDPDAAAAALRPVAARMRQGGLSATVSGTYSRVGDTSARQQLSAQRAQTVADVLTGLGVTPSKVQTRGLGSTFPGYVPDRDSQGHLVPAAAALNRLVLIDLTRNGAPAGCT